MPATTPTFRTVTTVREQYLRQNETRIRDAALPIHSDDPAVALHVDCILQLETVIEMHEAACTRAYSAGKSDLTERHGNALHTLFQLKLHHLSHLASLLL